MIEKSAALLQVEGLKVYYTRRYGVFQTGKSVIRALDGVDFGLDAGKTLAVVGESGSGKTTLGRAVAGLLEPQAGKILFKGERLEFSAKERENTRRKIQMVFQDSFSSLNPRKSLSQSLGLPLRLHELGVSKQELMEKALESLEAIDLLPPHQYIHRFPHELSGGQRQRVCIMRAMIPGPELVVADEPVSALDVSIRSQILNLLKSFQERLNLAYIFITHDLSVARIMGDHAIVMYCGRVMEQAEINELYDNTKHPYTRAFLSAVPNPNPRMRSERTVLKGDPASPTNPPRGCRFVARCPDVFELCYREEPALIEVGTDHLARCHLFG
jgi:peptide/nickel transport system ATP-binding protein/oligopeptide transport system ATP-binding protein